MINYSLLFTVDKSMSEQLAKLRESCFKCHGDILRCHPPRCPMRTKTFALNTIRHEYKDKTTFEGENPPSFFVGSTHYPNVSISPMISLADLSFSGIIDEPDQWKTNYSIPDVVNFRTHLIRTKGRRVDARQSEQLSDRLLEKSRELVLSTDPVYSHFSLDKPLRYDMKFNQYTQPIGPSGKILNFESDTPKIDHKVDYYTSDNDLLAKEGITSLFDYGLSVTRINRILSAGMLGVKGQRKLVPTRWSITATDDNVGKFLINEIKDYPTIDDYRLFESFYLDNHFLTLLLPKRWAFEFLECWNDVISGDYELFEGRHNYASNSAGGYYAARIAILEYLQSIKRQAEVLCWRYVGDDYYIPLGVWQVRENVRSGMKNFVSFDNVNSAFKTMATKLQLPFEQWKHKSFLLNMKKRQTDLFSFIK